MTTFATTPVEHAGARPVHAQLARPTWLRRYVRVLVAADLLAGVLGGLAAAGYGPEARGLLPVAALLPFAWVAGLAAGRAYQARFLGSGGRELRHVVDVCARSMAVLGAAVGLWRSGLLVTLLLAVPAAAAGSLAARIAGRAVLQRLRRRGMAAHRVVVTGTERSVAELVRQLHRDRFDGLSVVAACIDGARSGVVEGVPVLGKAADVLSVVQRTGADVVAVGAWSPLSQAGIRRLSWQLEGTGVSLVMAPSITEVSGPRLHVKTLAGMPVLHIEEPEFTGGRRVLKGLLDRVLALVGLILLSPLLLALCLAIRLTSRGPAVFSQERVGRRGVPFQVHKLRTMRVGAEAELQALLAESDPDSVLFKLARDPRVTPLGAVLRRFSLDELPQLVNVLKGEMSLVGPRPPLPREVAQYDVDVHRRLLVKPGITGLWQVSGRSNLRWAEAVRLDLHYVENWSIGMDLRILARTVAAVLRREGAY